MSAVIPEGWSETTLGKFSNIQSGVGFPKKYQGKMEGTYPVYKVGDVSKGVQNNKGILTKAEYYVSETEAIEMKGKVFEIGSTLFAKIGEAVKLNRRGFVKVAGLADNNVMSVKAHLSEMDQWTHYYLKTIDLATVSRSTTVPSVRKGDIEELRVNLPPLAEQKVIADKLDELLAQVESTKASLDAIPAILKSFRQSVLKAAVSGKLTEEWRGDSDTSQLMSIDNVCHTGFDGPFGSKLKTADYTDSGVRVARLENVGHLNFIEEKQTFISENKHKELTRNTLEENDILFSSFVEEEVRVCLFPKHHSTFINKADCFCLRVNDEITQPKFVVYVLASRSSYEQIKSNVQGVTRPRINLKILKSLTFRFPTLNEQTEIVRRLEELFAFADKVEAQVNAAQARVNHLTQSILAKAFRGELTSDWRAANPELITGDNSAEALLERIKAERESLAAKKKPVKKTNSRKKA